MNSDWINALLLERSGYVRRGLSDRVAAVDAQLRELNYDHKYLTPEIETTSADPVPERAIRTRATRRKTD